MVTLLKDNSSSTGMWYASPGNQGWGSKANVRNTTSVLDADITSTAPNVLKPSAGRVIRIVNNLDHNVQVNMKNPPAHIVHSLTWLGERYYLTR